MPVQRQVVGPNVAIAWARRHRVLPKTPVWSSAGHKVRGRIEMEQTQQGLGSRSCIGPSLHLVPVHALVRPERPDYVGHNLGGHVAAEARQNGVLAVVVVDVEVLDAQQPMVLNPLIHQKLLVLGTNPKLPATFVPFLLCIKAITCVLPYSNRLLHLQQRTRMRGARTDSGAWWSFRCTKTEIRLTELRQS